LGKTQICWGARDRMGGGVFRGTHREIRADRN